MGRRDVQRRTEASPVNVHKTPGLSLLGLLAALPASAQREPVLKQIDLPHRYYFREMYLPQATSGPSALAWSPDGGELVISMQGSLWRLVPGSGSARQVTDGPGYDYQPDWSPDGRFIAYASYRDDAVDLWELETATGRTLPLLRNRAVNLEPRFSPDGTRLAFVSTVYNRRFHIHTLDMENGEAGALTRLTEDHDSGLPRYYYDRHDHYLSPTWSPDGREILYVSNRGHVYGSGGLWRMKASPGAPGREIHYEETSWKARPEWAPDGRRVVYASYRGRPWHQLFLLPAEGGDPFPIGYGEFDATAPRWSRDGRRIAYISNQGGDLSLWIQEVPGGRRQRVEISERRRLGAVGRLGIEVVETAGGPPTPVRMSVAGPDGRSFAPDDAWRHADDSFDRSERRMEYGYFHSPGSSELTVPAGEVTVEVTHGPEYRVQRQKLVVEAGGKRTLRLTLERLADMPARGWYSGDLHVHMNYGGAYRADPSRLAFQAGAEDVHVVENLIVNKEERFPDVAYFTGRPDPVSSQSLLLVHDQEYHTSSWGHLGLLGLTEHVLLPGYADYVNTAAASLFPPNALITDLARAQGAISGYVHPLDEDPRAERAEASLIAGLPVDAALGRVDYCEVVGFSDHLATNRFWYRLLNCGFRIPAGAGTDAMTNYASLRGPVGMNRVFARSYGLDHRRFLEAIKAGRTIATNGPLVELALRPAHSERPWAEVGDEITLRAGGQQLEARVRLKSFVVVDRLEVVGNGEVVATVPLAPDGMTAEATVRLPAAPGSAWYLLRAWGERARYPVLDHYPFGTTSPIYVTVAGAPVRSRADALYFGAWVDRLKTWAGSHPGWNTAGEKEAVLNMLAEAGAVYRERATGPSGARPRP
jgi:TolB protein